MKKILVLDQNLNSVFATMFFNDTLKNHGIEFQFLQQLPKNPNEWECKKIIINPPFVLDNVYWENLKLFIESATEMQILIMTPDIDISELEELIGGKYPNVEMLTKKMGGISFEDLIESIKKI